MKTCPSCGQPVADGSSFCGKCGTPIPEAQAAAEPVAFCSQCGEKIKPGVEFCPNCGAAQPKAAVQTPKAAAPGKRNRIIGIAAVVVVLLLLVMGVSALPGMFVSPAKQFVTYQEDLFMDRILSTLEETLDTYGTGKFSTDMTITANVNSAEIDRYLQDSSVLLKVDLNRDSLLVNGELNIMGSPILTGALTYDKGKIGFCLPEVDNTYYTMDASKVLSNMSGQDIDLSGLKLPEISGKEWRSLAQSYLDVVYTVVNKDNVEVEKNKSFRLSELGGSYTGTVYTFTPKAEDVEAMLIKLADNLEKDKTLRELVLDLVDPDMLNAAFGYDIFGGSSLETELDDALLDAADTLRRNAAYIGEEVAGSGFTWTLYTEGKEVRMIRIETRYSSSFAAYECKGKESEERTELFYATVYGDTVSVENTYTKKGDTYKGEVTLTIPYEGDFTLEYEMDKSKKSILGCYYGTYELSIPAMDLQLSMEVAKGSKGGTDHIVTVRANDYYFDGWFDRIEVTLNTTDKSSAKKPSGKAMDISDYSMWELYELFDDLGTTLSEDLMQNIGPLVYGW